MKLETIKTGTDPAKLVRMPLALYPDMTDCKSVSFDHNKEKRRGRRIATSFKKIGKVFGK